MKVILRVRYKKVDSGVSEIFPRVTKLSNNTSRTLNTKKFLKNVLLCQPKTTNSFRSSYFWRQLRRCTFSALICGACLETASVTLTSTWATATGCPLDWVFWGGQRGTMNNRMLIITIACSLIFCICRIFKEHLISRWIFTRSLDLPCFTDEPQTAAFFLKGEHQLTLLRLLKQDPFGSFVSWLVRTRRLPAVDCSPEVVFLRY